MLIYRAEENPRFLERLVLWNMKTFYFSQFQNTFFSALWIKRDYRCSFEEKKIWVENGISSPEIFRNGNLPFQICFRIPARSCKLGVHLFPGSNTAQLGVRSTGGAVAAGPGVPLAHQPAILTRNINAQIFTTNFVNMNFVPYDLWNFVQISVNNFVA